MNRPDSIAIVPADRRQERRTVIPSPRPTPMFPGWGVRL